MTGPADETPTAATEQSAAEIERVTPVAGSTVDSPFGVEGHGMFGVSDSGDTTGFGGLRIPIGPPNLSLYGTVGARYIYSGTKLSITGPVGIIGTTQSAYKNWVNPVGGIAGQYKFDDRWFMNTLFDFGGWSKSATGQGLASVGYNWTSSIATTLGYRVLYIYEKQDTGYNLAFEPRSFRYQQWMYGPFAGFKYSF